jgi:hypothetical protein
MKFPAADSFTRHESCPAADRPLSTLERRVVHLGRIDADRGDRGTSRSPWLGRLFAMLTGISDVQPLAEERLEMLRRYASATRRGDKAAMALASQLREFGFSADALGTAAALARR